MASALRLVRVPLRRMSYAKHIEEETRHAAGAMHTWKKISFFVVVPALAYCTYNAYAKEKEHEKHIEEHGRHFIAYPHLRIRTKPFPWGDGNHSLFHNSHSNALPEGYEESEH
ncbi:cytochrome c oxidase subunit 6A, mitochondrial-like [Corticium candelabrum]|uniref:cytochrome c oxidase subunit 6A, mitochondrial-like n=1 Tax=Corticium candelabrum TaxID=121492 RepID=UPI002E271695|nr:cytochrome c oxidase subunit 6A, mitochondrial-like [Corticium candelabrum]